jgi:hypothetical protein
LSTTALKLDPYWDIRLGWLFFLVSVFVRIRAAPCSVALALTWLSTFAPSAFTVWRGKLVKLAFRERWKI